jgi:hypothetical protein
MEKRDLVRKSSGRTEGVAKFDTVCAADLIALREAVRLDLKVNPSRGKLRNERLSGEVTTGVLSSIKLDGSNVLISMSRSG